MASLTTTRCRERLMLDVVFMGDFSCSRNRGGGVCLTLRAGDICLELHGELHSRVFQIRETAGLLVEFLFAVVRVVAQ